MSAARSDSPERGSEHRGRLGQARALVPVAGVCCGVRRRHELEDAGQRPRRVEVVIHVRPEGGQRARVHSRRRRRPLDDEPAVGLREELGHGEAPGQPVQSGQGLLGIGQRLGSHLNRRAVVGTEHQQPVGAGVVAGEEVGQRGEVAQRLGHLRALDLHPAVVHPVPREGLAVGDRLRPLVLVVRELQVLPAAVQVEALTEQVERHDDALGVPSRPASSPR